MARLPSGRWSAFLGRRQGDRPRPGEGPLLDLLVSVVGHPGRQGRGVIPLPETNPFGYVTGGNALKRLAGRRRAAATGFIVASTRKPLWAVIRNPLLRGMMAGTVGVDREEGRQVASEDRVHRLILPNNPADAYIAIRKFAASLEEPNDDESVEEGDKR